MKNLQEYEDKKIKVFYKDGEVITGDCIDYTEAYDNDPEMDSITVDTGEEIKRLIFVDEIKTIEIIEDIYQEKRGHNKKEGRICNLKLQIKYKKKMKKKYFIVFLNTIL